MATHTQPDTMWPTLCHKKSVFRTTFQAVYEARGERLKNLALMEKGDKVYVDWKRSGVFVFCDPANTGKMTQVKHIDGAVAELSPEDQFDVSKVWEVVDNWCELRSQLKVGKAVTKTLDFFAVAEVDRITHAWAKNKDFLQKLANEKSKQHSAEDQPDGAESSVGSAGGSADHPTPAPQRAVAKAVRPPPPKPAGGRVRAKRVS